MEVPWGIEQRRFTFTFDTIAALLLAFALLELAYIGLLTQDYLILYIMVLGIAGTLFGFLICGARLDPTLQRFEAQTILKFSLMVFALIVLAQTIVTMHYSLAVAPIIAVFVSASAGIMEELFFRFFLYQFLLKISRMILLSTFISAPLFTLYHLHLYTNPIGLMAIFVSSLVITVAVLHTKLISVGMTGHAIFNAVVTIGGLI